MGKTQIFVRVIRPQSVYRPGAWIEGIVHVASYGEINARAVRLKYFGEEKTSWRTNHGNRASEYGEVNELWTTTLTLWGYPKGDAVPVGEAKTLPRGSYAFPFCVQVPPQANLPTAKYCYGHVQYVLQAYIDIPFAIDKVVEFPIKLGAEAVARNETRNAALELEMDHRNGFFICTCFSYCGSTKIHARCLNPEVLPGEQILCTAEIKNMSMYEVEAVEISLLNRVNFRAHINRHHSPEMIETSLDDPVLVLRYPIRIPGGKSFSNLDFTLPSRGTSSTDKQNVNKPFAVSLPLALPPSFTGPLITSSFLVLFRVCFGNPFCNDALLSFELPPPPLSQPQAVAKPASTPADSDVRACTAIGTGGRLGSPVFFESASTGLYQTYFLFDDLDYNCTDQQDKSKPVSYPCFFDSQPEALASSLDSFKRSWRAELAASLLSDAIIADD